MIWQSPLSWNLSLKTQPRKATFSGLDQTLAEPDREWLRVQLTARDGQREIFQLHVVSTNPIAVSHDKNLRGGDSDTLVTVNERVIHHERVHQCRRLRRDVGIQILAAECHRGSRHRRFESPLVTHSGRAAEIL